MREDDDDFWFPFSLHGNILIIVTELIDIESVYILIKQICILMCYLLAKVFYLNMFHEVPWFIKVLATG